MADAGDRPMKTKMDSGGYPTLRQSIQEGIKNLYQTQQLCDVTLVADGRRFPCHRPLLASVSLYFQRMFASTFKESREGEIVLVGLSAATLRSLLEYAYTGDLQLQGGDAEELFAAASRLQITPALDILTSFLVGNISIENCLELYVLAYSHNHQPLLRPVLRYVASQFPRLSREARFLALDFHVLLSILASNSLAVDSEAMVYRAVRHWVEHDPDGRQAKLPMLMDHVRLPLLTPEELANVRAETEELYECVRLPWEELGVAERLWASRGLRRGMYHDGVVCVGLPKWTEVSLGDEDLDSHVHFFDPCTEHWEQLPDLRSLTSPSCASTGHKLYVAGGQHLNGTYSDHLLVYDTIGGFWLPLPPMSTSRAGHALLLCGKKLYVAGGWDRTGTLVSAESYDLEQEAWAPIADLPFSLTYFSSTTLGSCLYLIGGEMGDADPPVPHRGFLVYDVASAAWSQVSADLECFEATAVAMGDSIFVIGGLTGSGPQGNRQFTPRCLCLCQDGTPNQALSVPPLPIAISYPGVARWRKRIYVFGGDSHDLYSSAIHFWEPGQQQWTRCSADLPDPNYGAFGFGCLSLKVPRKNIHAVFHRGSIPLVEGLAGEG